MKNTRITFKIRIIIRVIHIIIIRIGEIKMNKDITKVKKMFINLAFIYGKEAWIIGQLVKNIDVYQEDDKVKVKFWFDPKSNKKIEAIKALMTTKGFYSDEYAKAYDYYKDQRKAVIAYCTYLALNNKDKYAEFKKYCRYYDAAEKLNDMVNQFNMEYIPEEVDETEEHFGTSY